MEKILVIGCAGQIGSELTVELRKIYGDSNSGLPSYARRKDRNGRMGREI